MRLCFVKGLSQGHMSVVPVPSTGDHVKHLTLACQNARMHLAFPVEVSAIADVVNRYRDMTYHLAPDVLQSPTDHQQAAVGLCYPSTNRVSRHHAIIIIQREHIQKTLPRPA